MALKKLHADSQVDNLQDTLARVQAALDATTDALICINDKGIIEVANPATEKMFGYAADELIGKNISKLMPEPHRSQHDGYISTYLSSGNAKVIGIGRELEGQRKDGTVFPMSLSVGRADVHGKPIFSGIIHDISLRRAAETARDRFGRLVEQSLNEIYVFDSESLLIVDVNKGAVHNLGYSRNELITKTPLDLKTEFSTASFRKLIEPVVKDTSKQLVFNTKHRRKDGSTYDAEVHMQKLALATEPNLIGAIVLDTTERNILQNQLHHAQKMDVLGQLTGGVAHDFNNLLAAIIGSLEVVQAEVSDNETAQEFLTDALDASDMAADLTRRLLTFARRQPLEPELLDLNALLRNIQGIVRRTLGSNITIDFRLKPNLGFTKVDPTQFESTVLNLAINARDAMEKGGKLTIETNKKTLEADDVYSLSGIPPGDYFQVIVSDTGIGMPSEVAEKAFEPFFTTKKHDKGTGLGLSMAYGFLKQSGGYINLYSEVDKGTVVTLYFPIQVAGADKKEDGEQSAQKKSAGNEKILVVDDNDRVRKVALRHLESLGYKVLEAVSAENAVDILAGGASPDLVFTDVVMPGGKSGPELAEHLLETGYTGKIVFTSGFTEDAVPSDQLRDGRIALIQKPYSSNELAVAIRSALES